MTEHRHERFLSTGGAAKLCQVKPSTVRRWIRKGIVPVSFETLGGHKRIAVADLVRAKFLDVSGEGKAPRRP